MISIRTAFMATQTSMTRPASSCPNSQDRLKTNDLLALFRKTRLLSTQLDMYTGRDRFTLPLSLASLQLSHRPVQLPLNVGLVTEELVRGVLRRQTQSSSFSVFFEPCA